MLLNIRQPLKRLEKKFFQKLHPFLKDLENEESRLKVDLVDNKGRVNSTLTNDMTENALRGQSSSFEILPKSVSLIWQNAIREDLRSSLYLVG